MDKEIEKLQVKLRNEMSTRMDDVDIVEILEVLQGAEETIEQQQIQCLGGLSWTS